MFKHNSTLKMDGFGSLNYYLNKRLDNHNNKWYHHGLTLEWRKHNTNVNGREPNHTNKT